MLILIAPGSHIDRANPPTYFTRRAQGQLLKLLIVASLFPGQQNISAESNI